MDISNKKSNYHDNKVEIYNGTMLLFGPKLLRNEITQSWRHQSKKKSFFFFSGHHTPRLFQEKAHTKDTTKICFPKTWVSFGSLITINFSLHSFLFTYFKTCSQSNSWLSCSCTLLTFRTNNNFYARGNLLYSGTSHRFSVKNLF